MSELCLVNGSQLVEQGPSSGRGALVVIMRILSLVREASGLAKRIRSAAFASWRKNELQVTDRKTRKFFAIYGALHEARGLICIEDCVELAIRGLEVYFHGSEERLIQAAGRDKIDGSEAANVLKRSKKEKRLGDWEEKVLLDQY